MELVNQRWKNKTLEYKLNEGEIHLWRVPLEIDTRTQISYWRILSQDEKDRADRFKFVKDKVKFIAGRGALRILLAKYLCLEPQDVEISYWKNGKPQCPTNIEFNLSNSGDWAVIGITLNELLGVDIELSERTIEFEKIGRRFFSPMEYSELLNSKEETIHTCFYNCWTRKEAFIKALGDGLSFPLDQFAVTCKPGVKPELIETLWDHSERYQWSLWGFKIGHNYIGAIASRSKPKSIEYLNWYH